MKDGLERETNKKRSVEADISRRVQIQRLVAP